MCDRIFLHVITVTLPAKPVFMRLPVPTFHVKHFLCRNIVTKLIKISHTKLSDNSIKLSDNSIKLCQKYTQFEKIKEIVQL